ncbi:MAG: ABC transporter substrate-binding protein [Caldicoprobacterales bacterium]
MRKTSRKKGCGVLSVFIMLIVMFVGCSVLKSSLFSSSTTPVVEGQIDTSRYVKLSMFLAGPSSEEAIMDYKDTVAQLNAKLKDSINANVEITFVAFDELDREYPLIFNSKEIYDVVYTSSKATPGYFTMVEQESLQELDDLLPVYASNVWEMIKPSIWEDARYKGKIYGIPLCQEKYRANGYIYRGDLLEKYEIEPLISLEGMEEFMDTLLEEEVGMTPIGMTEDSAMSLYDMLVDLNPDWIPAPGIPHSSLYLVSKSRDNISSILCPVFSTEFMEFAKEMKDWAEKGYWREEVLTEDRIAGLDSGKDASMFVNLCDLSNGFSEGKYKFFCFGEGNHKVIKESAATDLLSISADSRNGERALMMLEFIMENEEFKEFLTYGMQGQIFKGVKEKDMLDYYENISIKDPYGKFTFDASPVEQEIQNVVRVNSQYGIPILLGKAGDPETAVKKYREELKAAGIQKVIDTVQEQLKDFTLSY